MSDTAFLSKSYTQNIFQHIPFPILLLFLHSSKLSVKTHAPIKFNTPFFKCFRLILSFLPFRMNQVIQSSKQLPLKVFVWYYLRLFDIKLQSNDDNTDTFMPFVLKLAVSGVFKVQLKRNYVRKSKQTNSEYFNVIWKVELSMSRKSVIL